MEVLEAATDGGDVNSLTSVRALELPDSRASWLDLLASILLLQLHTRNLNRDHAGQPGSFPLYRALYMKKKRSWDFMPSDIVRPFASTTVHDIAVLGVRLGLRWTEFKPAGGILIAEGNNQTITSTTVRSIGLLLHYQRAWSPMFVADPFPIERIYVPMRQVDNMAFGVVTWAPARTSKIEYLKLGTIEEIRNTWSNVKHYPYDDPQLQITQFSDCITEDDVYASYAPGLMDILGIGSPLMRFPPSTLTKVPRPFPTHLKVYLHDATMKVFHHRLIDYIQSKGEHEVSKDVLWVLQSYTSLREFRQWEIGRDAKEAPASVVVAKKTDFLDRLQEVFTKADHYEFEDLREVDGVYIPRLFRSDGRRLALRHIYGAIAAHNVALKTVDSESSWVKREPYNVRGDYESRLRGEAMHLLFPTKGNKWIISYMESTSFNLEGAQAEDAIIECWLVMMLRGFCWARIHQLDEEGPTIPSKYLNSQMPVYIG